MSLQAEAVCEGIRASTNGSSSSGVDKQINVSFPKDVNETRLVEAINANGGDSHHPNAFEDFRALGEAPMLGSSC